MCSLRSRLRERGPERGTSSLELVLYMPLLMMTIFLTVQFALVYLGNQVISSSARQAARVARAGGLDNPGAVVAAQEVGQDYATRVGHGLVTDVQVNVVGVSGATGREMRVVVTGQALQLVPGIRAPQVSKTVQGPIEFFRADTP